MVFLKPRYIQCVVPTRKRVHIKGCVLGKASRCLRFTKLYTGGFGAVISLEIDEKVFHVDVAVEQGVAEWVGVSRFGLAFSLLALVDSNCFRRIEGAPSRHPSYLIYRSTVD